MELTWFRCERGRRSSWWRLDRCPQTRQRRRGRSQHPHRRASIASGTWRFCRWGFWRASDCPGGRTAWSDLRHCPHDPLHRTGAGTSVSWSPHPVRLWCSVQRSSGTPGWRSPRSAGRGGHCWPDCEPRRVDSRTGTGRSVERKEKKGDPGLAGNS